jgi:hypothetical protein
MCNCGHDTLMGLDGASPHVHDSQLIPSACAPLRSLRRRHREAQGPRAITAVAVPRGQIVRPGHEDCLTFPSTPILRPISAHAQFLASIWPESTSRQSSDPPLVGSCLGVSDSRPGLNQIRPEQSHRRWLEARRPSAHFDRPNRDESPPYHRPLRCPLVVLSRPTCLPGRGEFDRFGRFDRRANPRKWDARR